MSNETSTETTEVVEDTVTTTPEDDGQESISENPETPEATEEPESQSKREARYRRQLRDTEAERDALRAKLEALQRAEVERLAGQHLVKPSALWAGGVELSALVTDEGTVNAEAVEQAALSIKDELGLEGPKDRLLRQPYVPDAGTSYGSDKSESGWERAFKL